MEPKKKWVFVFISLFLLLAIIIGSFLGVTLNSSASLQIAKGADLIWEKNYGGVGDDRCFYGTEAEDGYVLVGSSTSFGQSSTEGWVLRINKDGDVLWNRTFNAGFGTEFRYVLGFEDGFLLVGNTFLISGATRGYVVKIDADGSSVWDLTLGEDNAINKLFSATKAQDSFILVGLTEPLGSESSHVWIIKISLDGDIVWNNMYSDLLHSAGRGVTLTEDGCYAVCGYTNVLGNGDYDFLLLKIDVEGLLLWNRTYGGVESDKAYSIASTIEGYVMAGDTRSKGSGDSDAWIVKTNLEGNLVWDKVFGGIDFDSTTCIFQLSDGGYAFGGVTFSFGNGLRDFWLFKVDNAGKVNWSCTVGRNNYEEAYAVVQADFNKFVMVGWTSSLGKGRYDFYAVSLEVAT